MESEGLLTLTPSLCDISDNRQKQSPVIIAEKCVTTARTSVKTTKSEQLGLAHVVATQWRHVAGWRRGARRGIQGDPHKY